MNLIRSSLRRPLTVAVLVIALSAGAWIALQRMTRDVFPPLGVPTIYVAQPFGGMDPAQMEGYLTYYYEYHFLYITGIEHVESKSIQGAALLKLQFHPGTDMSQALAETINYANRARAFMPPGTVPPFIMRFDAGSVPVGNLVFSSETRSVAQMQDAALNLVRPLFATLPGVSAPPPFGGSARSIVVSLKSDRLKSLGLAPEEIVNALSAANTISPSGNLLLGDKYPMVPVNSVVKNIRDLETVPIRPGVYPPVLLREVAEISDASDIVTSYALVNGRRTVYIPVTKRADASTLSVVDLVRKNIPRFQSVLPDDVKVSYEFDQSPYVTRSIRDLLSEGLLGACLTGLMVLLFLRDWRSALVVVVNIPLSLMAALFALWVSGKNINLMTLGGLALAVGILVDEATVTIENIHAHLARGKSMARAALDATEETALPRLLAMTCVVAVFIPAFFMIGTARALFVPLAMAVGFAMIASFLLSSTLVPILATWLLKKPVHTRSGVNRFRRLHARWMHGILQTRWLVVLLYLGGTVALIAWLAPTLGRELFPRVENGQLQLRFRAPTGTRVDRTEAIALQILDLIRQEAGSNNVAITLGFVGVHAPSYPINLIYLWNGGPEEGVIQVQLKPEARIAIEPLKEKLRSLLAQRLPGVGISFEPGDLISRVMSFGSPTPVEVAVSGPNLAASLDHAGKIRAELATIPGLRDLQFGQALDYPTLDVAINRERAGILGIRTVDAVRSLVPATSSSRFVVPNYWADPGSGISYQVQVQVPTAQMVSVEDLRNVPITGRDGKTVLLRNLASITPGIAAGQYERYNMQRMITVTANITDRDLGSVSRDINAALRRAGEPPPKVRVDVRGQVVPLNQMMQGLQTGLVLVVAVIFLLLAANFQSVRLAFAVIFTVPAVIAGVILALRLTHTTLNIESFMGAIMAVGVAVANAILLVTFAEKSRITGLKTIEAAAEGAGSRLRPILMTSLAMISGMLPMALGIGGSSEQTAPLARAVIGGLAAGTLATLFVLPAAYAILQSSASTRSGSLDPDDPDSTHFDRAPITQ